ncbi:MAG: ABC transporter permease, partial [Clostridia bacterium]|nr:ABC transporter permease [Clostridia bacterium]
APIIGKKIWLESIPAIWNMLTVQGMMAARNLSRNKGRSIFIYFGILFCFAISGFTWSMNDMFQKMLFDQYEKVELYDVKITTTGPSDAQRISRELEKFPGVYKVEPILEVPITLEHNWLKKDLTLKGLSQEGELYNILDKDYHRVLPPENGLLLSERLAKVLQAPIGTVLTLENLLPNSREDKVPVEVVGVIPQYLGINAYMEINAAQDILQQRNLATSFMLILEKDSIPLLKETYRNSKTIASIDEKQQSLAELQEMMATFGSLIYIFAILGVIIGFAIIYSSSIITLSERSRELASMLVLGMTPREVLTVITEEQWFIAILAMLTGIPVSQLLLLAMSQTLSNDLYTLPTTLTSSSFIIAFLVTSLSIWIGQQVAAKKIQTLSLVEVLKSVE